MDKLNLSHAGFKAYDIRGIVPDEVNEELAYRVGRAYADLYLYHLLLLLMIVMHMQQLVYTAL